MPVPSSRLLAPAILGLALGCAQATAPTSSPPTFDSTVARIAQAFADSARTNGVIGAQLAVSIPGEPVWTTVFGDDAPGTPMASGTLLGTGSISKMLAAVAALRLVDRGVLTMTDTLGRWFPGVPNLPSGLALSFLLWNQSGLPEYGASPAYAPAVLADLHRSWTADELIAFVGPTDFAPGSAWRASNTDRLLLATIGARATGRSHGDFLREELFSAGQGEVWSPGQTAPPPRIGTHWSRGDDGLPVNYSQALFGPSLFTSRLETFMSARELVLFARRMFEGDLLSAAGRAQLLTIVPDDGRIPGQNGGGVGIRRHTYFGRTMYGNSGATTNSSAMYLYDPGSGVIVSMNTNQEGGMHRNSHFNVVPALIMQANAFVDSRRRP